MTHLAYCGRGAASFLAATTLALAAAAGGCTAGVRMSSAGSGGSTGSGGSGASGGSTGTGGRLVVTGSGGGGGDVVMTGSGGMISADGGCMKDTLMHTPTLPTVMILVDLSGSEFDTATTGVFFNLRPAVEQVVMQLQGQVQFGIASFVGNGPTGSCSLVYDQVAPALNNYNAIKAKYESWGPLPNGTKANTPMYAAIPMVQAALQAVTTNGPKYMMLVTDSETDFCDDGNALCPADAITYLVQNLYNQTPSIGTLVVGIPDTSSPNQIEPQVLKNLANAGVGQGVGIPTGSGASTTMDFWYQCNGSMTTGMAWQGLFTAAGRTGMTSLADYTTVGTASAFTPSDTSTTGLVTQISAAINTIPPSCVFDLASLNNPIKVDRSDTSTLATAGVYVNNQAVQFDPNNTNGWDMISDTELQLFGQACTDYQMATASLNLEFPCKLIIMIDQP